MDPIRDRIARIKLLKGQRRQDDETNRRELQNKAREIVQKKLKHLFIFEKYPIYAY